MELKLLSTHLESVSEIWRNIGQALGVEEKALQEIQEVSKDPEESCRLMLEHWLLHYGQSTTWDILIKALENTHLEDKVVENIRQEWGRHERIQNVLNDSTKRMEEIESQFLQDLAVVVSDTDSCWYLLAPFISPCSSEIHLEKALVIDRLQEWKKRMHPTYKDLAEILDMLYIQPPLPPQYAQDDTPPYQQSCVHSCRNSLSDLCSTSVHSEEISPNGITVECRDLGFSLAFPQGAVNFPIKVSVCCSFRKEFKPPSGYEFVSPAYIVRITGDVTFLKKAKLTLQHWAKIEDNTRHGLCFAFCTYPNGKPPLCYKFELQEGGVFESCYATTEVEHFSTAVIVRLKRGLEWIREVFHALWYINQEDDENEEEFFDCESENAIAVPTGNPNKYMALLVFPDKLPVLCQYWYAVVAVTVMHKTFKKNVLNSVKAKYEEYSWIITDAEVEFTDSKVSVHHDGTLDGCPTQITKSQVDNAEYEEWYPPTFKIRYERSSILECKITLKGLNKLKESKCTFTIAPPGSGLPSSNLKSDLVYMTEAKEASESTSVGANGATTGASSDILNEKPDLRLIGMIRYTHESEVKEYRVIDVIATEWKAIAQQLGLEQIRIKIISDNHPNNSSDAANDMLGFWRGSDLKASWAKLIRAMEVKQTLKEEASKFEYALLNRIKDD